jgi:Iron-containing redox enzyme
MSRPEIDVNEWKFADFFNPLPFAAMPELPPAFIIDGRIALESSTIENHPFFEFAAVNKAALVCWVSQEVVITNLFAQVLFNLLSKIENVHLRSIVTPVAAGEHSSLRSGVAYGSHPHLLSKLALDVGLTPTEVKPLNFTVEFAHALSSSTDDLAFSLGFLGIGNESLLVPEYTAVEAAFEKHFSREVYRPFLRANIEEDKAHSGLMELAAINLVNSDSSAEKYAEGARAGVDSRLKYYGHLLDYVTEVI